MRHRPALKSLTQKAGITLSVRLWLLNEGPRESAVSEIKKGESQRRGSSRGDGQVSGEKKKIVSGNGKKPLLAGMRIV